MQMTKKDERHFWSHYLDIIFPKGLNQKKLSKCNQLNYKGFSFMEILVR